MKRKLPHYQKSKCCFLLYRNVLPYIEKFMLFVVRIIIQLYVHVYSVINFI